jgi:hypothetical protein
MGLVWGVKHPFLTGGSTSMNNRRKSYSILCLSGLDLVHKAVSIFSSNISSNNNSSGDQNIA